MSKDNWLEIVKKQWGGYGKYVLVIMSIVFVSTYFFFLLHEPINADWLTVGLLKYNSSYLTDQLGRWGRRYAEILALKICNPCMSMLMCMTCLFGVAMLLIDMWHIKEMTSRIAIGVAMVVSPAVVDTMQYTHTLLFYMPALFFSVLAAFFVVHGDSYRYVIAASAYLVITLSIYQAYIGVYLFVGVGSLILNFLSNNANIKKCVYIGLRGIVTAFCGCAAYYVGWMITKVIWHTVGSTYAGIDNIMGKRSIEEVFSQIVLAYRLWIGYFQDSVLYLNYFWIALISTAIIAFAVICVNKIIHREYYSMVIAIVLTLIIPLVSNIMTIVARGYGLEGRTSFQCQLVIPFAVALIDKVRWNKYIFFLRWIELFATFLLIVGYEGRAYSTVRTWEIGNRAFKYQVQTAVTHAIEDERYEDGMPIVFMNFPDVSAVQSWNPLREYAYNEPYILWHTSDMVILGNWRKYVLYYFGIDIGEIRDYEYDRIWNDDRFKVMETYPSQDAYEVIDGVYVIKFADPTNYDRGKGL